MARVITRYRGGSRKLYDRTDSRYISLDEIPELIRRGERLRVVDNASGADVTGQVLAQVISESERRGVSFVSADALHEIIRSGERLLADGVRRVRREMDRLLAPGEPHRLDLLRSGLRQLERSLTLVGRGTATPRVRRRRPRRVRPARAVTTPVRTDGEER
jgi:polyhydroxyalkanoate synthesis repressor PhaR